MPTRPMGATNDDTPSGLPLVRRRQGRLAVVRRVVLGLATSTIALLAVALPAVPAQATRPSGPALPPLAALDPKGLRAGAAFGTSVAVSGTAAVIGAPYVGGGLAFVYTGAGGSWRQVAQLHGSDTRPGDFFGGAVAISGRTIVVGADLHANAAGRVYVFTRRSQGWRQTDELTIGTRPGTGFGWAVAAGAGTIVASALVPTGAAYVFTQGWEGWHLTAKLSTQEGSGDRSFGFSVGAWGGIVVVGDPSYKGGAGRAYVFRATHHGWAQAAALAGRDTKPGDNFGFSVAASAGEILVGAPWHNGGAAYLFSAALNGWRQTAKVTGGSGWPGDQFGYSVALQQALAVVGAPQLSPGRAFVFSRAGPRWRQTAAITGPAPNSSFGAAVAVSGTAVIIGANGDHGGIGSAWAGTAKPAIRAHAPN